MCHGPKPAIPKGTRDFAPLQMVRRNYIFDTIKSVFQLYGYQPIETPSMELLSTLLGKYGEEGDKLLFRVLNSGDFLSGYESKALNLRPLTFYHTLLKKACATTSPFLLPALWCNTETTSLFLSNVIRFNLFGVPTGPRKADTASFISAMWMWWEATRCLMRPNWFKS